MSRAEQIGKRFGSDDPARDLLGRGGMGTVYRATDSRIGDVVAVKVLDR